MLYGTEQLKRHTTDVATQRKSKSSQHVTDWAWANRHPQTVIYKASILVHFWHRKRTCSLIQRESKYNLCVLRHWFCVINVNIV